MAQKNAAFANPLAYAAATLANAVTRDDIRRHQADLNAEAQRRLAAAGYGDTPADIVTNLEYTARTYEADDGVAFRDTLRAVLAELERRVAADDFMTAEAGL